MYIKASEHAPTFKLDLWFGYTTKTTSDLALTQKHLIILKFSLYHAQFHIYKAIKIPYIIKYEKYK